MGCSLLIPAGIAYSDVPLALKADWKHFGFSQLTPFQLSIFPRISLSTRPDSS